MTFILFIWFHVIKHMMNQIITEQIPKLEEYVHIFVYGIKLHTIFSVCGCEWCTDQCRWLMTLCLLLKGNPTRCKNKKLTYKKLTSKSRKREIFAVFFHKYFVLLQ